MSLNKHFKTIISGLFSISMVNIGIKTELFFFLHCIITVVGLTENLFILIVLTTVNILSPTELSSTSFKRSFHLFISLVSKLLFVITLTSVTPA